MKWIMVLPLFFGFINEAISQEVSGILVPDQLKDQKPKIMDDRKLNGQSPFLVQSVEEKDLKKISNKSLYIVEGVSEQKIDKQLKGSSNILLGSGKSDGYLEIDEKQHFEDIYRKAKEELSFKYFWDSYNYYDQRGVFQRTFEEGKHTHRWGNLQVGWSRYLFRPSIFNFRVGANGGIGFMEGRGRFSKSGEQSNAAFKLTTIPADLYLAMSVDLFETIQLDFSAGPSVLGLWQSRSDREDGDADKKRIQVGRGYFYEGALKFSVTHWVKKDSFRLFYESSITNFLISLNYRVQSYSKFQDADLSVDGNAVGMGVSFEYL